MQFRSIHCCLQMFFCVCSFTAESSLARRTKGQVHFTHLCIIFIVNKDLLKLLSQLAEVFSVQ
uniref:Secreted protein n=1 Tax=Arundo donax TaxID=35708 RepID=A0A0A9FER9_ARUDO